MTHLHKFWEPVTSPSLLRQSPMPPSGVLLTIPWTPACHILTYPEGPNVLHQVALAAIVTVTWEEIRTDRRALCLLRPTAAHSAILARGARSLPGSPGRGLGAMLLPGTMPRVCCGGTACYRLVGWPVPGPRPGFSVGTRSFHLPGLRLPLHPCPPLLPPLHPSHHRRM